MAGHNGSNATGDRDLGRRGGLGSIGSDSALTYGTASWVERARILLPYRSDPLTYAVGEAVVVIHQTVKRCLDRAVRLGVMAALDDSPRPGKARGAVKWGGLQFGRTSVVGYQRWMTTPRDPLYADCCYPAELISYAVWLYFRFPLSLRMVEGMPAARGISVTYETIRQWGLKFGREFANRITQRAPRRGDKWHLDEVVITIAGEKHWLWRAVDQERFVLDVLVQSRRDRKAAERLFRELLKKQGRAPRVLITDKRSKSQRHVQRFLSTHDQIANNFSRRPSQDTAAKFRIAGNQAWAEVTGVAMAA